MPLLNYTTKVDTYTTLGSIQGKLAKHGARRFLMEYDTDGNISSLSFEIETQHGPRGIRLPVDVSAVQAVLLRQKVKADRDQAERVAWRIVKDWVEAQLAILESGMVQMEQIFLPYMLDGTGQTLFQAYQKNQLKLEGECVPDGL